jgi:hypothetical protein
MKCSLVSLLILSVIFSSCKTETKTTKVKMPDTTVRFESYSIQRSGLKCKLITDDQDKDVFLEFSSKDEKKIVFFREFQKNTNNISMIGLKIDDYSTTLFNLEDESDDIDVTATGTMFHDNPVSLVSEGKVILITGKLSLYNNEYGTIERSLQILKGEAIERTDFEEIAQIEKCEKFTGKLM